MILDVSARLERVEEEEQDGQRGNPDGRGKVGFGRLQQGDVDEELVFAAGRILGGEPGNVLASPACGTAGHSQTCSCCARPPSQTRYPSLILGSTQTVDTHP